MEGVRFVVHLISAEQDLKRSVIISGVGMQTLQSCGAMENTANQSLIPGEVTALIIAGLFTNKCPTKKALKMMRRPNLSRA
jgi:hypothetical protein